MNKLIQSAVVALILAPSAGVAQDLDAGLRAYDAGDFATALSEWMPLAGKGDAVAQYNLGLMYDKGNGVPQDYAEAVKLYRLAAKQGHASAQYNLGNKYELGEGVPQDYVRALIWYNFASRSGHADAEKGRDNIAAKLTLADISVAQKLARVCMESNYQDCD